VKATRASLASEPDTASVPAPVTAMEPDDTVMFEAATALSNSRPPAPDLVSVVVVTPPPVSEATPDALLTVRPSATTPSGRTEIAAAVPITALSPA